MPHATGTVRRHVGPDCDVTFTGNIDAVSCPDWVDDTTQAGDAAEAWAFVVGNWTRRALNTRAGFSRRSNATRPGARLAVPDEQP
nr:hypothetical protein [Mycobacterium lepraemurium]